MPRSPVASAAAFLLLTTPILFAAADLPIYISRADLDYTTPATRPEEGHPIGNGRVGSLVWTTPSALHFQINRVDVFGQDSYTTSFPKQDSDYASGCGFVDINVADAGDDVFTGPAFHQHLSVYDAATTVTGNGLSARVLAWPAKEVIAIELDDRRDHASAINVDLRMLRFAIQGIPGQNYQLAKDHAVDYRTAEHSALSKLGVHDDARISLTQVFREHDHYSASAVAIGALGRPAKARYLNESTVQLSLPASVGKATILISTAATLKKDQDPTPTALADLATASSKGFAVVSSDTQSWWHDYWSRGHVSMHSPDGQADSVGANYTYFLYLMGCTSHGGHFPPRFGGLLFYTNADMRRWGSQYWWANTVAYYANLLPANRPELLDPLFDMYTNMLDACALAAKQQWGAQGIWVPEITFFNGPDTLPDDIAAELQDLMLARKPYDQRSDRFQWWVETKNRHNARYNFLADGHYDHGHYVVPTKGAGIFGHCTHILCDAARIGRLAFDRYEFTLDRAWLKDRAYPFIRGAAEFYRTFPNVQKGDDGLYHILHVNNNESGWDSSDAPHEITGMRTAFSTAIAASKILDTDADLRPKWQEILDHLAPPHEPSRGRRPADNNNPGSRTSVPLSPHPVSPTSRPFGSFVYGGPGAIPTNQPDAELKQRFLGFNALGSFIDPAGIGGPQIFRNRLRLREGPGAIDAEHIAGLAMGIHSSLLDSTTGDDNVPTLEVFPDAWPRSWDCSFQLLARGGFLVSASLHDRQIAPIQIHSPLGGPLRLRNPWPGASVTVTANGATRTLAGQLLTIYTTKGDALVVQPTSHASQSP